jgi:hypothetical protein
MDAIGRMMRPRLIMFAGGALNVIPGNRISGKSEFCKNQGETGEAFEAIR